MVDSKSIDYGRSMGVSKMRVYIVACCALVSLLIWYNDPPRVQTGTAKVASPAVKRAMQKMGPLKAYRMLPCGTLQVKVKGKWLRLKY